MSFHFFYFCREGSETETPDRSSGLPYFEKNDLYYLVSIKIGTIKTRERVCCPLGITGRFNIE